jgi:hypothetical protein
MWYSKAPEWVGCTIMQVNHFGKVHETTGFVIPFMPCLQSTCRYLNKRASSKLQQEVLWKCNLIRSQCQISELDCAQSILPWQITLLRRWCPLQPHTYVRVDSRPSQAWKINAGTDCVGKWFKTETLSNITQHCRDTVPCESIRPPWTLRPFATFQASNIKI